MTGFVLSRHKPLNALDRHIALVGFMGAGKTTMAGGLSRSLHRPVADIDREIEARYRSTIPQIFERDGEETFRRVEAAVICDVVGRRRPEILDLGGGAVTFEDNRGQLADTFVLFLDVDVE
ncbi:MAG: shikimate kinase, partial [Actinomycetota bacterium]